MELLKINLDDDIVKITVGEELSEDHSDIQGNVELDIENQAQFIDLLASLIEEGRNRLIIDMTLINYIDSSGLWALFEGHKKATQNNGKLVLLNPTKDVKRVLDITKMSTKINTFFDLNEAVDAVK